jgi:hypothetical protein
LVSGEVPPGTLQPRPPSPATGEELGVRVRRCRHLRVGSVHGARSSAGGGLVGQRAVLQRLPPAQLAVEPLTRELPPGAGIPLQMRRVDAAVGQRRSVRADGGPARRNPAGRRGSPRLQGHGLGDPAFPARGRDATQGQPGPPLAGAHRPRMRSSGRDRQIAAGWVLADGKAAVGAPVVNRGARMSEPAASAGPLPA